ncbi:MAG: ChbG/HpnK family deacetylase [Candidatus Acidiferrum sp.]
MKNLIVNADDLGWTDGVNRGIEEAHRRGLVTSASLLANGQAFAGAIAVAAGNPRLGVGVHLNLSDGPSTARAESVSSLLGPDGELQGGPESQLLKLAKRKLLSLEVEREWEAQITKILAAGIHPTHLDGHKHVHMLPGLFELALTLAKRHGIGAIRISHEDSKLRSVLSSGTNRNKSLVMKQGVQARALKLLARDARKMAERAGIATTDYFCGIAQTGVLKREGIEQFLRVLPDGTTELMSHPGYVDADLRKTPTRLQESRQTELDILTDRGIRKIVATQGIRLINFKEIAS